jgi:hypothetical protein
MIVSDLSPPPSPPDSTYGGESQTIIHDLGHETFDGTLLSIDDGVFELLAPPVAPIVEEKKSITGSSTTFVRTRISSVDIIPVTDNEYTPYQLVVCVIEVDREADFLQLCQTLQEEDRCRRLDQPPGYGRAEA